MQEIIQDDLENGSMTLFIFICQTNSGYVTEVHHVNGDGEDAGVVYCEMQGREN